VLRQRPGQAHVRPHEGGSRHLRRQQAGSAPGDCAGVAGAAERRRAPGQGPQRGGAPRRGRGLGACTRAARARRCTRPGSRHAFGVWVGEGVRVGVGVGCAGRGSHRTRRGAPGRRRGPACQGGGGSRRAQAAGAPGAGAAARPGQARPVCCAAPRTCPPGTCAAAGEGRSWWWAASAGSPLCAAPAAPWPEGPRGSRCCP
jgi:hypothetical protein